MLPAPVPSSRRQWLGAATALGALLARPTRAAPPTRPPLPDPNDPFAAFDLGWNEPGRVLTVDLPQRQYTGAWNPRPRAMRELASELSLRTRLEPLREPSTVTAGAPALFATPFLYVAGEQQLPPLGDAGEAQLGRFIDLGGMIVFDAALVEKNKKKTL